MPVEAVTFVNDLVVTNPLSTDTINQGDNHLRAIKTGLRNTFPNATRAFYFPTSEAATDDFTLALADMGKTFVWNPTGSSMTVTLPSSFHATNNSGWKCSFLKSVNDTKHCFFQPASGTVNGFTKVRRAIPFEIVDVVWAGGVWTVTRSLRIPIGTAVPYSGTLPKGHLNGAGGSFSSADYPELFSVLGSTTLPGFVAEFGGSWAVAAE